ncbi:NHL repeat-containing protein [Henriciella litoralis]|uniref:hypothetical protein n=1 Tax=Henriciella litoralis TaxID=568102 RepID=UPI000A0694DE|nr:hypothetical protein [Henriciella litoralis]
MPRYFAAPLLSLLLASACQPADSPAEDASVPPETEIDVEDSTDAPATHQTSREPSPVALTENWAATGLPNPSAVTPSDEGGLFVAGMSDGTGQIHRLSSDGKIIARDYATGLSKPSGLQMDRGFLYVADTDEIKVLHRLDGTELKSIPVSGATRLSGIAAWNASLMIAEPSAGRIYRLSGDDVGIWMEDARLEGVSSLTADQNRLVFASSKTGSLYEVTESKELKELATGLMAPDGVAIIDDGYLVSSLVGGLYFIDADGASFDLKMPEVRGPLLSMGDMTIGLSPKPGTVTAWSIEKK